MSNEKLLALKKCKSCGSKKLLAGYIYMTIGQVLPTKECQKCKHTYKGNSLIKFVAIERKENIEKGILGLKTGYRWFDKAVCLRDGDLITIAGRSGKGKSALALNMAMGISNQGIKVLFCSLEMSKDEVLYRAMASSQTIKLSDLSSGVVEDFPKVFSTFEEKFKMLTIFHPRSMQVKDIYELLEKYDCIFIDQLSNLRDEYQKGETKASRYGRMTQMMNAFCKEKNKSIFLCCQLNRLGAYDPQLEHLKDSGSIEEDSAVVFLINSDKDDKNKMWIKCAKNRNGLEDHAIKFRFQKEFCKISPMLNA